MDQAFFAQAGIDCADGLRRFSGNEVLYKTVLKVFLQDPSFAEIQPAIAAKDYDLASAKAHAVKGASGNLGMRNLYGLCMQFMQAVKDGDFTAADNVYGEMKKAYDSACEAVLTL